VKPIHSSALDASKKTEPVTICGSGNGDFAEWHKFGQQQESMGSRKGIFALSIGFAHYHLKQTGVANPALPYQE
jgi:hypothetical protein